MIHRGNEQHFFEYVDGPQPIVQIHFPQLVNMNWRDDARNARGRRIETHRIFRDPMEDTVEHRVYEMSRINDPLHTTAGRPASLGSYIQLKVNPSAIHICIKKNVQEKALQMLSDLIMKHNKTGPTRIVLKRTEKGRFVYSEWISTAALSKINSATLFDRLLKQTKNRTKYVYIILRQKHVGGAIHDRVKESESLL